MYLTKPKLPKAKWDETDSTSHPITMPHSGIHPPQRRPYAHLHTDQYCFYDENTWCGISSRHSNLPLPEAQTKYTALKSKRAQHDTDAAQRHRQTCPHRIQPD